MKVILIQNVKTLGKEGDIVQVSDGHAQNFLFPQNLAVPATAASLKAQNEKVKNISRKENKELSAVGEIAKRLEGYELLLQVKTNDNGTLYAAVTSKVIASALKKEGFKVSAEMIELKEPIKEPGDVTLNVSLPHGFEAEIRIVIEQK